jgi:60 kDa SS-A/Ro ribonucleoprotein
MLAQYVATGCVNQTFYASAETQLATVTELCEQLDAEFVAKVALSARRHGHMKDLPAYLVALLSVESPGLMAEVFDRVIDNPKMLRNFVQIMRSGVVGRKSLGTLPKRMVQQWLASRTDEQVFLGSVGNDPSMADIVKMVHPKPETASRGALYAYLIGREHDRGALPELVRAFEAFKSGFNNKGAVVPDVPMEMLTSLDLKERHWKEIARNASWQATRMNLNTFARHGVFSDEEVTKLVADKLADPGLIARARVFPYQLLAAFRNAGKEIPAAVREALQDAMEVAIRNVPRIDGKVWVLPDVSGSMHAPVTGHRQGATTAVRCIDVAALVAAAVVRQNKDAGVVPFESSVVQCEINPRDSVMTNANKLASLPSGGTNCAAPLAWLNARRQKGDLLIYVSDNESWVDVPAHGFVGARGTRTMEEWAIFKCRNPGARMVCIDIQPYGTTQAYGRSDVLNIGGFSDAVFDVITEFAAGRLGGDHWVGVIESMRI